MITSGIAIWPSRQSSAPVTPWKRSPIMTEAFMVLGPGRICPMPRLAKNPSAFSHRRSSMMTCRAHGAMPPKPSRPIFRNPKNSSLLLTACRPCSTGASSLAFAFVIPAAYRPARGPLSKVSQIMLKSGHGQAYPRPRDRSRAEADHGGRQRLSGGPCSSRPSASPLTVVVRGVGHHAGADRGRRLDGAGPSRHLDSGRPFPQHHHAVAGRDPERLSGKQCRGGNDKTVPGARHIAAAAPATDRGGRSSLGVRSAWPRRQDHVAVDRRDPCGAGAAAQSSAANRSETGAKMPALPRTSDGAGYARALERRAWIEPPHLHAA